MKFIHMADMHFDIPFTVLNNRNKLGEKRRLEQREAFRKVINFIKEHNIEYFFIAGDLYEHEYIRKTTIEYINNLFKEIPKTKVYIAPGNHDPYINDSMYKTFNWNDNVYIFDEKLKLIEEPTKDQEDYIAIYEKLDTYDKLKIEEKAIELLVKEQQVDESFLLKTKQIQPTLYHGMIKEYLERVMSQNKAE